MDREAVCYAMPQSLHSRAAFILAFNLPLLLYADRACQGHSVRSYIFFLETGVFFSKYSKPISNSMFVLKSCK